MIEQAINVYREARTSPGMSFDTRHKIQKELKALIKKITDEGPYILMFQPLTPVAVRKNVTGYKPGIVEDTYFFRTITKA